MRIVLVGGGALAEQCVEALVAASTVPLLLVSFDRSLETVASRYGISHVSTREEASNEIVHTSCSHLFSVNNPWVLPSDVLAAFGAAAINYHDSLLPAHAGLYATSWALLAGERVHGVTWHEMKKKVDSGAIYEQEEFPIAADDTAYTLNLKCFDAGLATFKRLLGRLKAGDARVRPQRGSRSYHSASHKPPTVGVLDFRSDATHCINLVRALSFGRTPNPLATAKFKDQVGWMLPGSGNFAPRSGLPPGTVVSFAHGTVRIATGTEDIELRDLTPLGGGTCDPDRWAAGLRLSPQPEDSAVLMAALAVRAAPHERFWVPRLRDLNLVGHPYVVSSVLQIERINLPRLAHALGALSPDDRLQAALECAVAYFYRLVPESEFDIGFDGGTVPETVRDFFAGAVPLRIKRRPGCTVAEFRVSLRAALSELRSAGTYPYDVWHRYPGLTALVGASDALWPMAISIGTPVARSGVLQFCAAETSWLLVPQGTAQWQGVAIDAQLAAIAGAMRALPSLAMDLLPLLDSHEAEKVLRAWNATERPIPRGGIHLLVEQQAALTPCACAVSSGGCELTYGELNQSATRLANLLLKKGVMRGDLVALCIPRSAELVIGLLGILKAGAVYVPVDPESPPERLLTIIRQSRPVCLVTTDRAVPLQLLGTVQTVRLDADSKLVASQEAILQHESLVSSGDDLAYVIFTSGSTGAPKGVEIEHAGLVNHALAIREYYALSSGDRTLLSASIGFDVAAEQIFPPLISGGVVVIRPDDLFESIRRFDQFVRQAGITVLVLPTAFWHEWVSALRRGLLNVPPAVRVVSVGTEKASASHLADFRRSAGTRLRFFQGYGPTEATITCTMYQDGPAPLAEGAPVPIGRPLPNVNAYVLGPGMQPVPVGINGELYVGGIGIARGYLGRDDLTRERFVDDPWHPGQRLYRTGDVVRWQRDGQLCFVGRSDFQVKVNGHRIEPGEVEAVLASHPEVAQCLVVGSAGVRGGSILDAYYVSTTSRLAASSLRSYLADRLPAYMVPGRFIRLQEFPLTINGKVDRSRLPPRTSATEVEEVWPRSSAEFMVASIWAEALGTTRRIGIHSDFFDEGGDSLALLTVIDGLQTHLGADVSMAAFLAGPTIAEIAARLHTASVETPIVVRLKGGTGTPLFCVCGLQIYVDLAQALTNEAPVFVILLPVEGQVAFGRAELPAVAALASMYIDALTKHLPNGPYALGGVSFGGVVAFEMARQLRTRGRPAIGLALFDSSLPSGRFKRSLTRRCLGALLNVWHRSRQECAVPGEQAARMDARRLQAYRGALRAYGRNVRPSPENVVLYAAADRGADVQIPGHGFSVLVHGRFEVVSAAGDHLGILRAPAVTAIGKHLGAWLVEAEQIGFGTSSTC